MITASFSELGILNMDHYEVHSMATIDGFELEQLVGVNPLLSSTVTADLDNPVVSSELQFDLGEGSVNLSPYVDTGAQIGGRPALDAGRNLRLNVACVEPGDTSRPWRCVFDGIIDRSDPADDEAIVKVRCRDIFCEYLDYYFDIFTETDQGFQAGFAMDAGGISAVLTALRDKALNDPRGGVAIPGVGPYTIGLPTLSLGAYWQQQEFLLMAMRNLGMQFDGWDLRGRWGPDPSIPDTYTLTYYDPGRERTDSDVSWLGMNRRFGLQGMPKDRSNVRNRITVIPADDARVPITVWDVDSILKYGLRPAVIAEDRASGIIDPVSGERLARAALADLKEPKTDIGVLTRLLWTVEINDLYLLTANFRQFDQNLKVAISGYVHSIPREGMPTTLLSTRYAPAAANREWTLGGSKQSYVTMGEAAGPGKPGAAWYTPDNLDPPPP